MDDKNKDLVAKSVAGDAEAFASLVERYYMMAYKVAYKWCGVQEDAQDIAQEAFVKLGAQIQNFRQDSSFETWLYRIVMNTAKDFYRKNSARLNRDKAFVDEQATHAKEPNQEESLIASQVYKEIDKLSLKMKEAVILVFCEGLSHREVAIILNCAETTISWRIFQAKKKLKLYLKEAGYE